VPNNDRGWGEIDVGGPGSRMAMSCRLARRLGYL
jgi:hypothetical protein